MRVRELWRYPVKSMGGEQLDELTVGPRGAVGDRAYGVADVASGTVLSAKREGRLLHAHARLVSSEPVVTVNGREYDPGPALDESLSTWLGRDSRLVEASLVGRATFQAQSSFEDDDSPLQSWEGAEGAFFDSSPLHLMTTGDVELLARQRPDVSWDVRRFRPNVVIEADLESRRAWAKGQRLRLGGVEIEVLKACERCVMTTRAQGDQLARELDVLRHVAAHHDSVVGVLARVVGAGVVRRHDPVTLAS